MRAERATPITGLTENVDKEPLFDDEDADAELAVSVISVGVAPLVNAEPQEELKLLATGPCTNVGKPALARL